MHKLMNEGKSFFSEIKFSFSFAMILVTNGTNNESTTIIHIRPEVGLGRKRKLRRVRSLIRSSIEKLTNDKEQTTKRSSTSIPLDKRPFPFGHW